MEPLTAKRAYTTISRRAQDVSNEVWAPSEVMESLDSVIEPIMTSLVQSAGDHQLDKITIPRTSFSSPEEGVHEYILPEWVMAVRRIEARNGQILRPFDIDQVELNRQHNFRGFFDRGFPIWVRGVFDRVRLVGRLEGFDSVTVWFIRSPAPMHYGVARDAVAGATANKFRFDITNTRIGRMVQRNDLYVGMQVEFETGNVDFLSRIADFDAATQEVTLETSAAAPIAAGDQYSLVVPTDAQYGDYVKQLALQWLLEDRANDAMLATMERRTARLEERFHSGIRQRDNARPKKIWNRRGA